MNQILWNTSSKLLEYSRKKRQRVQMFLFYLQRRLKRRNTLKNTRYFSLENCHATFSSHELYSHPLFVKNIFTLFFKQFCLILLPLRKMNGNFIQIENRKMFRIQYKSQPIHILCTNEIILQFKNIYMLKTFKQQNIMLENKLY